MYNSDQVIVDCIAHRRVRDSCSRSQNTSVTFVRRSHLIGSIPPLQSLHALFFDFAPSKLSHYTIHHLYVHSVLLVFLLFGPVFLLCYCGMLLIEHGPAPDLQWLPREFPQSISRDCLQRRLRRLRCYRRYRRYRRWKIQTKLRGTSGMYCNTLDHCGNDLLCRYYRIRADSLNAVSD